MAENDLQLVNRDGRIVAEDPETGETRPVSLGETETESVSTEVSLSEKVPTVDVDAFGAEGDGSVDDTQSIQTAADSTSGDSGILSFSGGREYLITSPISIDPSEVRGIEGNNATVILDGDFDAFDIEGSYTGTSNPDSIGAEEREEMNLYIDNLRVTSDLDDPVGRALNITQTFGVRVHGCQFFDLDSGIRIYGNNRNLILTDNHIYRIEGNGLFMDSGDLHQINVNDNHISYCDIAIHGTGTIHNLQINGNDIEASSVPANPTHNIKLSDSGGGNIEAVEIVGNTIDEHRDLTGASILMESMSPSTDTIKGVEIVANSFSNSNQEDIRFINMATATVADNTFESSKTVSVKMEGRTQSISVTDNVVRATEREGAVDATGGAGLIHIDGTWDNSEEYVVDSTISNNEIYTSGQPILIENTRLSNFHVSGNVLRIDEVGSETGSWVVDISGLEYLRNCKFKDNTIRQQADSGNGMRVGATEETLTIVKNNSVWEAAGTAFDLPTADADNVVLGDNISG